MAPPGIATKPTKAAKKRSHKQEKKQHKQKKEKIRKGGYSSPRHGQPKDEQAEQAKPTMKASATLGGFGMGRSEYVLGGDRADEVLSTWRQLTIDQKKDIIILEEDTIMKMMEHLSQGMVQIVGSPTNATVSLVQASVLHAMESNDGVMLFQENSFEYLATVLSLERQLLMPSILHDIHQKATLVMMYFLWISRYRWLGIFLAGFVVLSKLAPCAQLRTIFCHIIEFFLVNGCSDPLLIEWQAHSYIAALLLLYTATGTESYLVIGALIMIPYILNSIQANNHRLSDNSADKSALKTIRNGFSIVVKLVLVYFAWGNYSSLILVAGLFFMSITMTIASFSWIGIGFILSLFPTIMLKIVPTSVSTCFYQWKVRFPRTSTTLIMVIQLCITSWILYHTWSWDDSIWTGPVRWITCFTQVQLLPGRFTAMVFQLLGLALMLPVYVVQQIWVKISFIIPGQNRHPTSAPLPGDEPHMSDPDKQDSCHTTFDNFDFHLDKKNKTQDEGSSDECMQHSVD